MTIKCTNFRSYKDGTLQGFATIYIEKWGINEQALMAFSVHKCSARSLNSPEFTALAEKFGILV